MKILYAKFIDWKTQFLKMLYSQMGLKNQCNLIQNCSTLLFFWGGGTYLKAGLKFYVERQRNNVKENTKNG